MASSGHVEITIRPEQSIPTSRIYFLAGALSIMQIPNTKPLLGVSNRIIPVKSPNSSCRSRTGRRHQSRCFRDVPWPGGRGWHAPMLACRRLLEASRRRVDVYPGDRTSHLQRQAGGRAQVTFHPKVQAVVHPIPSAKVDPQGNFALTTYRSQDGAPAGEYSVTVVLRPVITKEGELELGANVLPPQYSSPKTTKMVTQVAAGANSVPIKIVR